MTASIYKFCLSGTIYMVKRKEAVNMKLQSITEKQIQKFRKYLINEEKSDATIEKYIRDVTALAYKLTIHNILNKFSVHKSL